MLHRGKATWGIHRIDHGAALIAAILVNANRKEGTTPARPADFLTVERDDGADRR